MPAPPLADIAAALRRERERAGLTPADLARRAGLAEATLARLENADGDPSIGSIWALADALGIPLARLFEAPPREVRMIPAGQGPRIRSEHADFAGALLSAGSAEVRRDLYLIRLEPGAVGRAEAHTPHSVEHVVVAAGRLRVGPESELVELGPGDYAAFPADTPHRYEALARDTLAVLVLEHP
ncbi:XRE family transcriptional regulator [Micromonospora sp. 15K316]|uniref:helix-turn-helix domain-containing protein n=1 Tax=Micromonospora sp. 15K316 TaxID=2530376 RepID=UPI001046173C|nr:XRE family transcriptional regulator [Micromonospora sp. 15K316]TDC36222.1 XRE family transcriptional regulator [Micromonospora sp. 15K316]